MKFSLKKFFNRPFFKGMASIFNIPGNYYIYNNYSINNLTETDRKALEEDWKKIGEDMNKTFEDMNKALTNASNIFNKYGKNN